MLGIPSGETCATDSADNLMVVDTNADSEIQISEALNVYVIALGIGSFVCDFCEITYFTKLTSLTILYSDVNALNLNTLVIYKL